MAFSGVWDLCDAAAAAGGAAASALRTRLASHPDGGTAIVSRMTVGVDTCPGRRQGRYRLAMSRPTISFMISVLPAQMVWPRPSTNARATGYSSM